MPLTRYYFDDGKARKFWSCSVSGKTLVTCYGRLDATGRETKKKMTSPAAAKAEAGKQAATKLKKGYIKVDPTLVKIQKEKGHRKATEKQVAALEKELGNSLPSEYREFLLTQNGGRLTLDDGSFELFGHPSPYGYIGCVGSIFTLRKSAAPYESLREMIKQMTNLLPKGHLPIADSGGNVITIDLLKKPGCVYLFDHELPAFEDYDDIEALEEEFGSAPYLQKHATLLAGTFNEFLTRMAVYCNETE